LQCIATQSAVLGIEHIRLQLDSHLERETGLEPATLCLEVIDTKIGFQDPFSYLSDTTSA
jgi:hypothetical protein